MSVRSFIFIGKTNERTPNITLCLRVCVHLLHSYTLTPRQSVGNSCPPRAWRGQVQPVVTLSNNSNTWVHPCYRVTFVTTPSLREPLGSWQSLVLSRHEIPTVAMLPRNDATRKLCSFILVFLHLFLHFLHAILLLISGKILIFAQI